MVYFFRRRLKDAVNGLLRRGSGSEIARFGPKFNTNSHGVLVRGMSTGCV